MNDAIRGVIQLLPEPTFLLATDGSVCVANAALGALLRCSPTSIIGRNLHELVEDEPDRVDQFMQRWSASGQFVPGGLRFRRDGEASLPCRCEGGVMHGAEQEALVLLRVRPRATANPGFTILNQKIDELSREVFERKRVESQLRRAEERQRFLIEATSAVAWTTSSDGRFEAEQPSWASFTGQRQAQYAGMGWLGALHPDDRYRTERAWNRSIARREMFQSEHRLRNADGEYRDMLVRAVPVVSDGVLQEWAGLHVDITDIRQAAEALLRAKEEAERANLAKSRFLANMSHELRTPLNAVIGYSELLQEEADDAGLERFVPELRKIYAAGRQLLGLVNDVLDLSKIEAGRMELNSHPFAVAGLIEDIRQTLESLIQKKHNTFVVQIDEALGEMNADRIKVRQILFNLIGNAAKFTENGLITLNVSLETAHLGDMVTFEVTDTGIGISDAEQAQLFQTFYRGQGQTGEVYEGTGLGLSITRHLCELMGGTITVESTVGVGTTFRVQLPRRMTATPVAAGTPAWELPPGPDGEAVVLVVDDDADARHLLESFLLRKGFHVVTASSGEEGLRLAAALHPAVMTLDAVMPEPDGWTVLSRLKNDPDLADIPVVMITFVEDRNRAFALGAAEYLTKPVDTDRLTSVVRRACRRVSGNRLLVVDDDEVTRAVVRSTFKNGGYEVVEAQNGQQALHLLIEQPPHVILLDLMMPEMDGFGFIEAIQKHGDWRRIPVIVLTSKDLTSQDHHRLNGYVGSILQKGELTREELLQELNQRVEQCVRKREG